LQGAAAESLELAAEALFLGSLVTAKRGREIELVSNTGADPMVGLKLGLRVVEKAAVAPFSVVGGNERGPRVRVFRASTAVGS
jgi:hypothetical protein